MDNIDRLVESGWVRCPSVAAAVADAGLPAITRKYLESAFSAEQWQLAAEMLHGLRAHFASARFAEEVEYGIVLIPDPARLDTRSALQASTRKDQLGTATADVFDARLPAGTLGVSGKPWTMLASVAGHYGPALGSYRHVLDQPASAFTVSGVDTRKLMIRQMWGARVLQSGSDLPDCEHNERWTFTLFPGEPLTEDNAESGTVLKGKVRFRLGKPDRGIGSARVAPAIAIP